MIIIVLYIQKPNGSKYIRWKHTPGFYIIHKPLSVPHTLTQGYSYVGTVSIYKEGEPLIIHNESSVLNSFKTLKYHILVRTGLRKQLVLWTITFHLKN